MIFVLVMRNTKNATLPLSILLTHRHLRPTLRDTPYDIQPLLEELFLSFKEPVMTVTLPDNFDGVSFDAQILAWLREGLPRAEVAGRAKERWPMVPEKLIQWTTVLMLRQLSVEPPPPIPLERETYRVYRKRLKMMKQVEAVIDAGSAPVSMHSLYRGLLRDHEAACYKIIACERLLRQDEMKQEQPTSSNPQPSENAKLNDILQKYLQLQEGKDDDEESPIPTAGKRPTPASFRSMSLLIGFIIAGFLAGFVGHAVRASQGQCLVTTSLEVEPLHEAREIRQAVERHAQRALLEHRPQVQHPILLSRGGVLASADCKMYPQRAGFEDHALQRHLVLMHLVQILLHLTNTDGVGACTTFVQPSHAVDGREDVLGHSQLQFIADEVIGASAGAMIAGPLDDLGGRVLQHRSAILVAHHQVLAGGAFQAGEHLVRFIDCAAFFQNTTVVEQERDALRIERRSAFFVRPGGFERSNGKASLVHAADDADGAGEADGGERLHARLLVDGDEGVLLQVAKPHVIHVAGEDGLPGAAAILVNDHR